MGRVYRPVLRLSCGVCEMNIVELKEWLKEKDIAIDIYGCGCCFSPMVTIQHKGETIFESESESIYMINKEEK